LSDLQNSGFDADALWERVDGDVELLRDLMRIFRVEFPGKIGGGEAACRQGDAAGLAKSGHKLKGSLLQFSGRAGAAAAQQLEELGKTGRVTGAEPLIHTLKQEVELLMKSLDVMVCRMAAQGVRQKAEKGTRRGRL